jgi:UDP-2,3-diacylglucosamine pyrophosphatase LpxH
MSDEWKGRFSRAAEKANEEHQTATSAKKKPPLQDCIEYQVPPEVSNRIRESLRRQKQDSQERESQDTSKRQKTVPSQGTATLLRELLVSVTYMDVGCWGGGAPTSDDTSSHWGKKRHFGIVYGRFSVLCAYRPWLTQGKKKEPQFDDNWAPLEDRDPTKLPEYRRIYPLLLALSTDPKLGPVVVTKAILNTFPRVVSPPEDRIYVILGDLHAPVMTNEDRTYSDRPHPQHGKHRVRPGTHRSIQTNPASPPPSSPAVLPYGPANDLAATTNISTGIEAQPWATIGAPRVPKADTSWATSAPPGQETGTNPPTVANPTGKDDWKTYTEKPSPPNDYPLRGRYDRGLVAPLLVPMLARIFGETAKVSQKQKAGVVQTGAGAVVAAALSPLGAPAAAIINNATLAALGEIAVKSRLGKWSDHDTAGISAVEDWFDRYHGHEGKDATDEEAATKPRLGADVFDGAGKDLEAWLAMLKKYQGSAGPMDVKSEKPPIRLMQLGDLFDFWIGLKCPFALAGGAREFPDPDAASKFVNYWLKESLSNPAIKSLWDFDAKSQNLKPVFLYGNHDTYMGAAQLEFDANLSKGRAPLPSEHAEAGLIAQHGHQDDFFNQESTATFGYLLTQAVFMDNYVRTIEDPMASIKTKLFGGMWTRLGYAEAALKKCVFQRVAAWEKQKQKDPKAQPASLASTFVMGHTHEPVLQQIDVTLDVPKKPKISAPPEEVPLPHGFVVRPGKGEKAKVTISFRQVHILKGRSHEPWNMNAYVRTLAGKTDETAATLLDDSPIETDQTQSLAGGPLEALVGPDDRVEIVVQGWQGRRRPQYGDPYSFLGFGEQFWNYALGRLRDLTPDFLKYTPPSDAVSVRVAPHTWEGTKTLGCERFLVTFDVDWA